MTCKKPFPTWQLALNKYSMRGNYSNVSCHKPHVNVEIKIHAWWSSENSEVLRNATWMLDTSASEQKNGISPNVHAELYMGILFLSNENFEIRRRWASERSPKKYIGDDML